MGHFDIPEKLEPGIPEFEKLEKFYTGTGDRPPLFPNYTAHGITHINGVLGNLNKLIPSDCLKPDAKLVLSLGVLFHDIGMFVSYSGLKKLLEDNKELRDIWDDYHMEKGITSVIDFPNDTRTEPEEKIFPTIQDFIRKHHHEVSELIVKHGFPELDESGQFSHYEPYYIFEDEGEVNKTQRGLVGILAKGHGVENVLSLGDEFEGLGMTIDKYGFVGDVPIEYLVSLLKLADTLDIGEHRANGIWPKVFALKDAKSYKEFEFNQSILGDYEIDNQVLVMSFKPQKTAELIKEDRVIAKAQKELNDVWAAIGRAHRLELSPSVSLIISNIDHGRKPREKLKNDFLTEEAEITVDPNIFTSLAQPLYGYDIYCGIRELIQNAVDACMHREKKDASAKGKLKITVNVDTAKGNIAVTDTGIGMNADTIVDYYLAAGSQYRESKAWRSDSLDELGSTSIIRSGRFGIGVLAGFLLGNKIEVTTRYYKDDAGYHFTVSKDGSCSDEIPRVQQEEPGTTICIALKKNVLQELANLDNVKKWTRWYYPSEPVIVYTIDDNPVEQMEKNPLTHWWPMLDDNAKCEPPWNELPGFRMARAYEDKDGATHDAAEYPVKIYWRLAGRDAEERDFSSYKSLYSYYWKLNGICCYNGIRMQEGTKREGATVRFLEDIDLSIVDKNAAFGLSLTRDSIEIGEDVEKAINKAILERYDHGSIAQAASWIDASIGEDKKTGTRADKVLVALCGQLWRVLRKVDGKALLVSETAFMEPFDRAGKTNAWAESSLKELLNGNWMEENLKELLDGNHIADPTDDGEDPDKLGPESKIFCLSAWQAENYFEKEDDADRQSFVIGDPEWAYWWLRSPGGLVGFAACVSPYGGVYRVGNDVRHGNVGVRPAFWLNLSS